MDWVRSLSLGAARDVASASSDSQPTAEVPTAMQMPPPVSTGGYNIQTALNEGAYKRFYDAFWGVFGKSSSKTADFKLPEVVVMGSESSGKSSLLENITKCEIFPRDRSQCTRAPIRFKLMQVASEQDASINIAYKGTNYKPKSQKEVLSKVKELMDGIPRDTIDDSAEIIINMSKVDVPTFEFVDLPGLVATPPAAREKSISTVRRYLQNPNTMVLCVVPATTPRLNTDTAFGMVLEAQRQQDTILVLTMADKVLAGDAATFEDDILKRVLCTAGELSGVKLLSCNAVINRSTLKPKMTVAEAAQFEDAQFTAALEQLPLEYKCSKSLIQRYLSTPSLIRSMDQGFQDFIGKKWRPAALDRFKPEKDKMAVELAALGEPVEDLSVEELLCDRFDLEKLCQAICGVKVMVRVPRSGAKVQLDQLGNHISLGRWGTSSWAQQSAALRQSLTHAFDMAAADSNRAYLAAILQVVRQAFLPGGSPRHLKLERFCSLEQALVSTAVPALYDAARSAAHEAIISVKTEELGGRSYGTVFSNADFVSMQTCIHGVILEKMIDVLEWEDLENNLPEDFALVEDEEHSTARQKLAARAKILKESEAIIERLAASVTL